MISGIFNWLIKDVTLTRASVPSSTWVRSKSSSWRGIGGSGTVWPLTPAERKTLVCRCLDSWVASTTSCQMTPLAPWLSSHLVRDAKVTKCTKILTHHRFILSDQFRPEQKGYKWLLSETLGFKCTRKYKMTLKLRLYVLFTSPPPEIKGIFVHPFLAERIISMLNYFLQHLVGPKMGALKVKDFSEFDFKPQQVVSDICTIYLNLG